MSRLVNLSGVRFGYLVVVCRSEEVTSRVAWLCRCDCGQICHVFSSNLIRGYTVSCGCHNNGIRGVQDVDNLVGRAFGRLTVVERDYSSKRTKWICVCSCGTVKGVMATDLKTGNTQSCGCWAKEEAVRRATTHGQCYTREYIRSYNRARGEKKKKIDIEWTTDMERAIREMFPYCVVCGSTDRLAVDHVLPMSLGNSLRPGNATILCKKCNSHKRVKNIYEMEDDFRIPILYTAQAFSDYWYA